MLKTARDKGECTDEAQRIVKNRIAFLVSAHGGDPPRMGWSGETLYVFAKQAEHQRIGRIVESLASWEFAEIDVQATLVTGPVDEIAPLLNGHELRWSVISGGKTETFEG